MGMLDPQAAGLLNRPFVRQTSTGGTPAQGSGWLQAGMQPMGQGGQPAYGSDEWAMQTGGPGAMIWREMARYMADDKNKKAPLGFLDPKEGAFSQEWLQYLGPQFQKGGGK
jgi:hypothetical protein